MGDLPEQLRLTLELSTGLNVPRALSSKALAAQLHVRVADVAGLQSRALRQLRLAAGGGCGAATSGGGSLAFASLRTFGGEDGPLGGVEADRYARSPSGGSSAKSDGTSRPGSALALDIPPLSSSSTTVLLLVIAFSLAIGVMVADGAGHGPRHARWRRRWMRRPW